MTYCSRCNRSFRYESEYDQHVRDSPYHWKCRQCQDKAEFESLRALKEHYVQSPRHPNYCQYWTCILTPHWSCRIITKTIMLTVARVTRFSRMTLAYTNIIGRSLSTLTCTASRAESFSVLRTAFALI